MSDMLLATQLEEMRKERDALRAAAADIRASAPGDSVWRQYAQPVLSLVVLLMFAGALGALLWRQMPEGSERLVDTMLGVLFAALMAVIQFWFGSSQGSDRKTEVIANLTSRKPNP